MKGRRHLVLLWVWCYNWWHWQVVLRKISHPLCRRPIMVESLRTPSYGRVPSQFRPLVLVFFLLLYFASVKICFFHTLLCNATCVAVFKPCVWVPTTFIGHKHLAVAFVMFHSIFCDLAEMSLRPTRVFLLLLYELHSHDQGIPIIVNFISTTKSLFPSACPGLPPRFQRMVC